jgi:hypothetical protein
MKLVRESLDFERAGDIKKGLGLGKAAKIREAMKELGVTDYEILSDFTLVIKHGHEDEGDINYEGDYLPSVLYSVPEIIFDNPAHVNLEYLKKLPDRTWFQNKGNIYLGSLEHLPPNVTFQPIGSHPQKVDLSSIKKENIPPSVHFGNRLVLYTADDFNVLESIRFERTGDVKKGLSLGKRERIHRWFREWVPDVEYEIRDDLSVYVEGSIDLKGSQVTRLPENMSVEGTLDLRYSDVTQLPEGLSVGGTLDLGYSQVARFPEDLSVGGNLYLYHSQVTQLPKDLRVGRYIYVYENQGIKVPENLKHKIKYV